MHLMPSNPWVNLNQGDARRIDSAGRFDFFWISLESGMPGLMLKLPRLPQPYPRLPKLKNLTISFRPSAKGAAFVLGLKAQSQVGIFETLCRDVISAGEAGEDLESALSRTIQRTRRWHHLMRGGRPGGLSVEEQRGLVGELAFVRELVTGCGPEMAIEAWTGPAGSAKDFEFIGSCVEVKTRRVAAKPFVSISSEDQLADVEGSRLFLRVVNVASAVLPEGNSLHDHVSMTAMLFEKDGDAFDAWEEALYSTGYDPENSYDGRHWQLGSSGNYEVVTGFPRITSPLSTGIGNVRYMISIDAIAHFEFSANIIEMIKEGGST
jgi:hypothetical protein